MLTASIGIGQKTRPTLESSGLNETDIRLTCTEEVPRFDFLFFPQSIWTNVGIKKR
jgi:hypothetical protein